MGQLDMGQLVWAAATSYCLKALNVFVRLLVLAVVGEHMLVLAAAQRIGGHFPVAQPLGYLEPF